MLSTEEVRQYLEHNYSNFVIYTSTIKSGKALIYQGIPATEMVNDAMIAVFDNRKGFESVEQLTRYIHDAIYQSCIYMTSTLKDKKFTVTHSMRKDDPQPEDYIPYKISYEEAQYRYGESKTFMLFYEIFQEIRYKEICGAEFLCPLCGCEKYYSLGIEDNNQRKCAGCRKKYSLTSGTNLHGNKLSYQSYYRVLLLVTTDIKISTVLIGKLVGITQKTAWLKKRQIVGAMREIQDFMPHNVLKRLLTPISSDVPKINPSKLSNLKTINKIIEKEHCLKTNKNDIF